MKSRVIKTGVVLFVFASLCRCDTVNMLNCKFERKNIDNFRFAGVNFDKFSNFSDIGFADIAKITMALLNSSAPITFDMNLEGKNPTEKNAALEQFKWKFLLDGNEILEGNIRDKFSIPAEGTSILPVEIGFDAWSFLENKTPQSLFNFYQNITGKNASGQSNASLKIRPTINGVEFPNYITIN